MASDRSTARIAGILFIAATAASLASCIGIPDPLLTAPDVVARLVPLWLPVWGLAGAILLLPGDLARFFGGDPVPVFVAPGATRQAAR